MDIVSEAQRSYNMSRIRGSNTKPEVWVRSCLHQMGFRFTVTAKNNRSLAGKPDIILPKHRLCLFVHGCFWHAHEGCSYFKVPDTRREWWLNKLSGNALRDQTNTRALLDQNWRVGIIWECALKNQSAQEQTKQYLAEVIPEFSIRRFTVESNG
jgi:DNA mismatch endonuclease (patch repair protein)